MKVGYPIALTLCFALCWMGQGITNGQDSVLTQDAKFTLKVDVASFARTKLGGRLIKLTEQLASEELEDVQGNVLQKVQEALGFDPLKEIRTIAVVGASYEDPQEHVKLVMQMGTTTGNLEGLALALPGYEAEDYGSQTIHAVGDGDQHAFATILTAPDGKKTILATTEKGDLKAAIDAESATYATALKSADAFMEIEVLELPAEALEQEQVANISKMLQGVSASLAEKGSDLSIELNLTASNDKRAEQIQQLAQGLKALGGLFEQEIQDDDDLQFLSGLIDRVQVNREQNRVVIQLAVPEQLVVDFLREEADLPL
ncbi:MAG: hypothetical protein KDB03_01980 [Planctomycetales bacterium]|nr:hypothetical protein [Planctomycetales bacterium]